MVAPGGHRGGGGDNANKYKNATNVKELLDIIGEEVYKENVKSEAAGRGGNDLKGSLANSSILGESAGFSDPCRLEREYTKLISGSGVAIGVAARGDPCRKEDVDRFSDKEGAQCDNSKIEGNSKAGKGTDVGACAPYRRLQLCNKNMEKMSRTSTTKHDLLLDVCLAANFEGESLKNYHDIYKIDNPDSQICTVLARSFADIGDIIRGRDLYRDGGRGRGKNKLENNLKKIFKNIYNELTTSGRNREALKTRYNGDEANNFFQLREDWWEHNREKVWKALTCDDDNKLRDASYFRQTCSYNGTPSHANHQCRCKKNDGKSDTDQVPTFFDYVPQYLRWFEEWAEDFCRKKKKFIDILKTNCRGENGEHKYCSGNGYDCRKTIYKKEISVGGSCGGGSTSGGGVASSDSGTNDKEKGTFYRSEYCQPCPHCGVQREGNEWKKKSDNDQCRIKLYKPKGDAKPTTINFLNSGDRHDDIETKLKAFCAEKNGDNKDASLYQDWKCHQIDQLTKDGQEGEEDPEYDNDVEGADGLCILKKVKQSEKKTESESNSQKEPDEIQKTFNHFFYYWVAHMLKDSIHWKKKLEKCLKNGNRIKCGNNKCNSDCKCFESWVNQKKEQEWKNIKEHFKTQKGFEVFGYDFVLEGVLKKKELLESLQEGYGNAKELEGIRQMLEDGEAATVGVSGGENKTTIDKLLQHEEEDANKCKECPKPEDKSAARIIEPPAPGTTLEDENDNNSSQESEEELENEEYTTEDTDADGWSSSPKEEVDNKLDVCEIVDKALNLETLKEACSLKYGPKAPSSWKCVTPTTNSSEGDKRRISKRSADSPTGDTGGICVPPRRRRLYIGKIKEWAGKQTGATVSSGEAASNGPTGPVESLQAQVDEAKGGVQGTEGSVKPNGQTAEGSQSHPVSSAKASEPVGMSSQTSEGKPTSKSSGKDPREALRDSFIQSTAVETFFLWHNYKEQFKAQHGAVEALGGFGIYGVSADGAGLVPFSGPQPTLPQAPFSASQGKAGPARLRPGAGLSRGPHGQPPGAQLCTP